VKIPPGESIGYDLEKDRRRFTLSDNGVVVVPKTYRFR
jgi:glucose-1-phosphate adenylyltransferase